MVPRVGNLKMCWIGWKWKYSLWNFRGKKAASQTHRPLKDSKSIIKNINSQLKKYQNKAKQAKENTGQKSMKLNTKWQKNSDINFQFLKKNQYNSKKKGWRLPASVGTRAHHTGLMPWVWISRPCIQAKCAVSVILVLLRWNGISRIDQKLVGHLEHHMQHYSKQEGRTFEVVLWRLHAHL